MRHFSNVCHSLFRYSIVAGFLSGSLEICAQQSSIQPSEAMELAATHNAAIQAFNRGDWAAAIDGLEKVIKTIVDPVEQAKIGPIYYTLGAAYFNAKNYGKAAETFRTYVTNYPGAQHVGEARLALARALFLQKNFAEALPLLSQLEAVPALREEALLAQAECLKEMGKPDERIRILEKLIAPEVRTPAQAGGAVALAEVYREKKDTIKVLDLVNKLYSRVALVWWRSMR